MKNKLQSLHEYESRSDTYDCVWLLKEIKAITLRFEGTRYIFLSLDDARTSYYGYVQPEHQTLSEYLKHFQSLVDVLEHYKESIGEDQAFLDKAGIMIDEEEPDPLDSNYAHLKTIYVAKRANLARNRTLRLHF